MLSTSYCTFAVVLSLKTASDCSLTYFRPVQKLRCSGLTWLNKKKVHKNHFWVLFHSAKSISNHFRTIKNFGIYFSKVQNFFMCWPQYFLGEGKWTQQKNTYDCSFIAQNPFHTNLELRKILEFFSQKFEIFVFRPPILHRWKKWTQQKITSECSFIAQNPFQTILGLWKIFQIFEIFWPRVSYIGFFIFSPKTFGESQELR